MMRSSVQQIGLPGIPETILWQNAVRQNHVFELVAQNILEHNVQKNRGRLGVISAGDALSL